MGQRPRDRAPGIHHVVVKSAGPIDYFGDHIDRLDWVRRFVRILERYAWSCILVCQMTSHVHAIVEVHDWSLAEGMQRLNCGYGKEFNARHGRQGNLVGARFWSKRTTTNEQLLASFRYAALNPVRARICERPEEWFWSSFATSCGLAVTFPFVDATHVCAVLNVDPARPAQGLLSLVRDV
jgi:putative transposase